MKKKRAVPGTSANGISATTLAEMVADATLDAYNESEQTTGWFTALQDYVELPFETELLGVTVTVEKIELRDDNLIVAVCRRGKYKQVIGLTELQLPTPIPPGAEWIEGYCLWHRQA